MTTNALMKLCGVVEMLIGTAMIVAPAFLLRAFFGGDIPSDSGVARGAGLGPLPLGLICWQRDNTTQDTQFAPSGFTECSQLFISRISDSVEDSIARCY